MDLRAAVPGPLVIPPGGRALVACGFTIEIPEGYEGQVRARSGLAVKHGVGVLNGPGTIDSDYRGEVKVILANFGADPFTVNRGDRVAQLVIAPVTRVEWDERPEGEALASTLRGAGGFGHTGK
jgi:dUTP pyrophosphatase